MQRNDMKFPEKPVKPEPSECCQSGCERCVFVCYEEALERWQEKIDKLTAKQDQAES